MQYFCGRSFRLALLSTALIIKVVEPTTAVNRPQWQVQRIIDNKTQLDRMLYNAAKREYQKVSPP